MKKYGKTIALISILLILGLGYYYYLANKDKSKDATDLAAQNNQVNALLSKNISDDHNGKTVNYPSSPKDVVNLYATITKAYYDTELTDEQIEGLGKKARILFDDELKQTQTDAQFTKALKADIEDYRATKTRISSYSIQSATKTKYGTLNDRQYASIILVYYIRSGDQIINSYTKFTLRKDDKGHWKILFWELAEESDMED